MFNSLLFSSKFIHNLKLGFLKLFVYVSLFCLNRLMSPLSKEEMRRDSSLAFIICHYTVIKSVLMYFCV